jgi:DNA-directed RNA polymerase I, II, and III subunit RPABC2
MEKLTAPRMTKFERAQIIGTRTEQIARGAQPTIEVPPGSSVRDIAVAELAQKKIPLKIQRQLPNGSIETWGVDEMDLDEI